MKKAIVITGMLSVLLIIAWLIFSGNKNTDPRGDTYAGSKACIKCHSKVYASYLHTAHFVASGPASPNTVHGSFASDSNVFEIGPGKKIVMEKNGNELYQTFYSAGKVKERQRFDIAIGGVKGESYLYWKGNQLYQLPISYFTAVHKWSTSPGYGANPADYKRSIDSKCLDCHASYIAEPDQEIKRSSASQQFEKSSLVYSVDCERCHGPAARHVQFHLDNPDVKTAQFMAKYSSLPRARKLDMCGICHSGRPDLMLRSSFGFKPGDTLAMFKLAELYSSVDKSTLDVHGNQLQLLQTSKCYLNSNMDCATCHDVHQNQRGNFALYSQKCRQCHTADNHNYCKMSNTQNAGLIRTNCIQCHMPALPTQVIKVETADKKPNSPFLVHTHHIAVYPTEVKRILAFVKR